jgi:cytochrome c-type biogenesis protein CcmE
MDSAQLEAVWRLAQDAVPPVVIGVWAVVGVVVALFMVRFRKDWREGVKACAALVVASVALGCFVCWARRDTRVHYRRVGGVLADVSALHGKGLQVHGYVACGSIRHLAGTDDYRFTIQHLPSQPDVALEVRYMGVVPDTFVAGNEVIVSGSLGDDGVLDAIPDGIMAKRENRSAIACATAR